VRVRGVGACPEERRGEGLILLYDEPPIAVSPTLAVAWGINDACFMQQVHYWCIIYEKKQDLRHLHNGQWWVYNTNEAWQA